ncbi:3-hydroxy-2-methylbutyryl-CoA dehydrogenase [Oleiphilus sp. HI0078]|jgi:NAD(P)-dependent dehydrogenase (short-subunit alcohol dehydrogenase family)|nr:MULTISPECIES: SDR family NAD(P)-dependent oxidoreductase [unclassified Oleiphilus]KZY78447.1 3-hydroxy-2-methylbutyryl-CoA dehydrogenase [Oleiphilus sp. HI0069]KZY87582.1 3-hydroxy-2-methylbutyryl-CoA dehydrogenase [Oleiphilus sp. HI0072]KZZ21088.1 3-hydroxy-2-methylbutyryl-CoA dehydrogenase [Oleiphilus sp. HI0078]KZZ33151.1 3-hydroxy-2-methylbutyryl-CoA dehydrogenase [Oleiphilus sp. HI0085]KZY29528.1 3-hydroxy-2-methylbutyryl-CoA dehydrogenase [Oleiphilus sp. HI0043]
MDIKGTPAIVTGGASGLGKGTALYLASYGAKVAILDLQIEKAQTLAEEIGGIAIECDVTSAESVEAAINKARETHGPCGIAVNCAGIGNPGRILGRDGPMSLDFFNTVIQVNLVGSFNVLRLAAADMQSREENADGERGVIISTASVAAYEGQIGQAAYSASKGGIVSMTLPAARELAKFGIRVLAIAPGLFLTPMMESFSQEVQDSLAATLPFPSRLGKPDEFGRLVRDIVENPILNGEVIRIDSAVRLAAK